MTYIIDAHEDISDAILYSTHANFWKRSGLHEGWNDLNLPVNNQSDFPRLKEGGVKGVFGVSCVVAVDKEGNITPHEDHWGELSKHLDLYETLVKEGEGKVKLIEKAADLERIGERQLNLLLAIEGFDSMDEELKRLESVVERGVRAIGLTWSFNNVLAGGCNEDGELTKLGERTIKRMEELGVLLDLSHINEKSYYQALGVSSKPVIVSHSACKSVFDHPRNISDEQIKAVAKTGGAVGICGVPQFMGELKVKKVVEHFMQAIKVAGIDHVIVGTDFGAMTKEHLVEDFEQVSDLPNLIEGLKKAGLKPEEIDKVCHGNLERILGETLPKK